MRNHIKNLFKHSFIFGLGESLRSITGIVLIPIYTRYLTPTDYGQLELLNITVSIMLIIGFQGIGVAFLKSYSEVDKNNESLINLVSTSYFYILFSSLTICSLMFLFSNDINTFLFGEHKAPDLFIKLISISIFSSLVSYIPFHLFRAELQSVKYIYISLANLLMQLSFNIIFVTKLKLGVKGILLGNVVSGIIALLITTLCIRRYLRFKISGKILKDLLSLGIPLVFATLSYLVMQSADRYLLQRLGSLEELGLYSLGLRFTSFLTFFVINPFNLAWGPLSFQIAIKENGKDIFRKVITYFFLCLCILGAIIIIWAPAIIKIVVGETFWNASNIVLPLIYAMYLAVLWYRY